MKKLLLPLIALVVLALAPNALAATTGTTGTTAATDACPTDNKQKIQNASITSVYGDTATASFTINPACASVKVSFVSYTHTSPVFTWENASEERVYDRKTQVLGPGSYTLKIKAPGCYYQLDLIEGEVIEQLGPAGSGNFYTPQGRLILAENGGLNACTAPVVTDVCANIDGTQPETPSGLVPLNGNCVKVAVQGKKKVTKRDMCLNFKGTQITVPKGKIRKNGNCVKVAVKGVKKPGQLPYTP